MGLAGLRDEEVMLAVARGDRTALDVLMRRHANSLLTFIARMAGDRHAAEELFQESFLAVWTSRSSYRFPETFRSWLFGLAVNKCRGEFRRRTRSPKLVSEGTNVLIASIPTPDEIAVATETATLVQQTLLTLPERQRAVVVLRIWNGLSYFEIGNVIACSESTARTHMFHGLAAIRRILEPQLR